ncbi:Hypothetical Protein Avi_9514 (plasmid) [Allorhizobium ampelinum S4]|uniref:SMODS and SLOG-associating 2TM effector domain-containing protein n=1 Tax=Allorhizobium ampelinum (strain ATCC BAA-846 / DSM 112012 / S4) TaxID=311402 RepID=B9K320_ALLAM|nr:hypothetical protein [Allorhizobium ampelinum]ACM39268.1 Hypothetical Protein Avi_9514 [Allorhizobium ampelinum S4]
MQEDIAVKFDQQLAYLEQDIRYYRKRSNFFDFLHTVTMIVVLLSSFAATISFVGEIFSDNYIKLMLGLLGFLNVFVTALDAVIGFSKHARKHDDSFKQASRLHLKMTERSIIAATQEDYNELFSQYNEIRIENPPIYKALRAICYNEVLEVNNWEPEGKIIIPEPKRVFAAFFQFSSWSPKRVGELTPSR